MASLPQLKKRLRGVSLTLKLSRAMKTVASAKYAKASRLSAAARALAKETDAFCAFLPKEPERSDAPPCIILLGYGRGLCGGYNLALHAFAEKILAQNPGAPLIVSGKRAIAFLAERGIPVHASFLLPDVPTYGDMAPLFRAAYTLFQEGKVGSVRVIYQAYINTLTQRPTEEEVLPLRGEGKGDILFLPSRKTALAALTQKRFEAILSAKMYEAAVGAQAATLAAMRTAADNAEKATARLENEINKKRQSAVTTGVLETSAVALPEGGETDG